MRIRLICVGTKMPAWVTSGFQEYAKRLPPDLRIELVEIPPGHRGKGADVKRAIEKESKQILSLLGKDERVVALDVQGRNWSTEQLAEKLSDWQMGGRNVALLVGGPDGLSDECLSLAEQRWSLSNLTFPHPLVRVILAEQVYRAWSLLNNHPYHRA
ncbi:MAG: 23S rRNA (pseudouridine(1915)-N(3))-methyltransferase RlmH [Pseudomonadales bacterium]|jgi:23S rRNA (pseudouridine1915-N3)-methyltransferase